MGIEKSFLAINGMGRIGRCLFRLLYQQGRLNEIVAIADLMSKENLIYLLKYDSIRGAFPTSIEASEAGILIDGHQIYYNHGDQLPIWSDMGVDVVIEATGHFTTIERASEHLRSGAKKVLLTTFSFDIPVFVWGVNRPGTKLSEGLISPGDCTINSVAPVLQTIHDEFLVQSVHINVIQGYTTRQELLDKPYKGFRRGRAAAHAIIPFEVNITPILEHIFPDLQNRIESMSTRVPLPCGAFAQVSIVTQKPCSKELVNKIFERKAQGSLQGVTTITYDPIVSADIIGNSNSGVIDGLLTEVTNKHHVRLAVWFDNEWGYVNRLLDWINWWTQK